MTNRPKDTGLTSNNLLILYDGVCGLCNKFNVFVLKRDRSDRFRFAPLQSSFAGSILSRHGKDSKDLDTLYLVENCEQPEERLYARSRAVLLILKGIGGFWRLFSIVFNIVPKFILDFVYRLIARSRYRIFGKYDACAIPDKKWQPKFIEI